MASATEERALLSRNASAWFTSVPVLVGGVPTSGPVLGPQYQLRPLGVRGVQYMSSHLLAWVLN